MSKEKGRSDYRPNKLPEDVKTRIAVDFVKKQASPFIKRLTIAMSS